MTALQQISAIARSLSNENLSTAQREGRPLIGYLCSFVPQEIIYAAGGIPVRLRATESESTEKAEGYFSPTHCSFVRHALNHAIEGRYGFLDAIVMMDTCDHGRRMADHFRYAKVEPKKQLFLPVPFQATPASISSFREDLEEFSKGIEQITQQKITVKSLTESIVLYNEQRMLLAQLYNLRKEDPPLCTGSEVLEIELALLSLPVKEGNELLTAVLDELPVRTHLATKHSKVRLLMASNHFEDVERMRTIESRDAVVVHDLMCVGTGHFHGLVDAQDDPLMALARRTLGRISCPRMGGAGKDRQDFLIALAKSWRAQGVILDKLRFCGYWEAEAFVLKETLEARGLPVLVMDAELYGGGLGQLTTRVEAFCERIRNATETSQRSKIPIQQSRGHP